MVYTQSLRQSTDLHRQNDYAVLGTIEHQGKYQRNIRKGKVKEGFRLTSSDGIVNRVQIWLETSIHRHAIEECDQQHWPYAADQVWK